MRKSDFSITVPHLISPISAFSAESNIYRYIPITTPELYHILCDVNDFSEFMKGGNIHV